MQLTHVTVRGVRYAVREWGAGRPLILLHGFTGCGALWATHAEALADQWRVLAPDLLGHGASDTPHDPGRYAMPEMVADLVALLDALAIPRAVLLGYSMGGRIALATAVRHPERIAALVLEGASPGLDAAERPARIAHDEALAAQLERDGMARFVDAWMAQPLFARQRHLGEEAWVRAHRQRLRNDPAALAAVLRGLGTGTQPSYWKDLRRLPMPTLLFAGSEDAKFAAIARAMAARIPAATLHLVRDAGHTTHLEQPDAFRRALLAFLAALPADITTPASTAATGTAAAQEVS